jgi:GT2 family glycosyltransferase
LMESPASPYVTVVVPNWNGERFLETCLSSLRRQSYENFEVVLADNGSTDGSVEFVEENFPEARVVRLPENRGFSAAVNAGIKAASPAAKHMVLLNNDTEVDTGWLQALVDAAGRYPEAGLFASKLVDFEDRRVLDGAGDALRKSGLPFRLGHGEVDRGQFEREEFVFSACAAAALYRRSVFEDVGLFDEDFFSNCEDGDLGFRAQLAGYRCLYVPRSVVYHVGSASTGGTRSTTNTRLGTQNSINLLVKNLPRSLILGSLPHLLVGQLLRLLTALVFRGGLLRAYLAGLAGAWRLLPLMLKKRQEIQSRRRVSDAYVWGLLQQSSLRAAQSQRRRARDQASLRLSR